MDAKEAVDKWGFEVLGISLILFALVRFFYRAAYLGVDTDQVFLYIIAGCLGFFFMTHKNILTNLKPKAREKKTQGVAHKQG